MSPSYYLNLAAGVAIRDDGRTFLHGVVGLRSDGAVVVSRNLRTKERDRKTHAEYRLTKKLDVGAIVYVARILRDGSWGNSRPCHDCQHALKHRGVAKVFYTIAPEEYGVLKL